MVIPFFFHLAINPRLTRRFSTIRQQWNRFPVCIDVRRLLAGAVIDDRRRDLIEKPTDSPKISGETIKEMVVHDLLFRLSKVLMPFEA